jgi:hypothetical protein
MLVVLCDTGNDPPRPFQELCDKTGVLLITCTEDTNILGETIGVTFDPVTGMSNRFYDHCIREGAPIVTTSRSLYSMCQNKQKTMKHSMVFVPSNNGHTAEHLLDAITKIHCVRGRLPSGTYTLEEIHHLLA